MPAAGFYPIESHTIRFGRDGEWYSDGERIDNRRIAQLFSRCVRKSPKGGYMLQMGDERAPLEVDDTPFVVRQVQGDPSSGLRVVLNDESAEPLDPETVRVGPDNAFTCAVKGGEFEARLLRPAHYQLASWITTADDGRFLLRLGRREYPIRAR